MRAAGATPLVRVVTATEHALATKGEEDVVIEDAAWRGDRPHGVRFGTLVHAVLATVTLDADRAQRGRLPPCCRAGSSAPRRRR